MLVTFHTFNLILHALFIIGDNNVFKMSYYRSFNCGYDTNVIILFNLQILYSKITDGY
jgi:hypothetical protein